MCNLATVSFNPYLFLFRHGERNPALVDRLEEGFTPIEKVLNPLMKQSTGISPSVDVKFPWKIPYSKDEASLLVPEGDRQLYNIGKRFATRFLEVLHGRFSIADFNFTSSCYSRASQSAVAFGMGYLEGQGNVSQLKFQPIPLRTYPCIKDGLTAISSACPRFIKQAISRRKTVYTESNAFLKSDEFQKIVLKVRRKLGLNNVTDLDEKLVLSMFRACAWGVEVHGGSEWCSLFTPKDQAIYDLYIDLYLYYRRGPAYQLNMDISCVLLQDIFTNLKTMARVNATVHKMRVVVRMGHATNVIAPLLKLGLFLDNVPLKAKDQEKLLKKREFRYGKIAPMSGGFAFVLYKCRNGEYKIQLYINERLVKLSACQSEIDCTLRKVLDHYEKTIDKCASDHDKMCKV